MLGSIMPSVPGTIPKPRLTELQKKEIIASVAQGEHMLTIAQRVGVHRNTVSNLCKGVQNLPIKGQSGSLTTFRENLDTKSFGAIERSLDDDKEPHRAANTGLQWLKGVGVLQGDQVNLTIQQLVGATPEDWSSEYIVTPAETLTPSGFETNPPADTSPINDGKNDGKTERLP